MADENSMLMQLCTENVYNDNIFHLLNLQTTATPRQIRRRREDLESAHEMGEEAWKREFGHLLGNRPVPSFEEVQTAFERLADPECHIVSEFFWMWPLDEDDIAVKELTEGKRSTAIKIWEQAALGYGEKRLKAQHNLAVLYQFYAIDAELQAIDLDDNLPADFHKAMCDYWERSFEYWEGLADNDDFWEIFEERMRKFDDPRLVGDFASRFRQQFPIAFNNINARLAAEYAKHESFGDAKRHVDYMLKTKTGLDDVEESLRFLFEPMEQKVKLLVRRYDKVIASTPEEGIVCAEGLLKDTAAICKMVQGVLEKVNKFRLSIVSDVVCACNRYAVTFGNKTNDWNSCLRVLEWIRPMACTTENFELINTNIETARNNIKVKCSSEVCPICRVNNADVTYTVTMYGDVAYDFGRTKWKVREVPIKVCQECKSKVTVSEKLLSENGSLLGGLIFIVVDLVALGIGSGTLGGLIAFIYFFVYLPLCFVSRYRNRGKVSEVPVVKDALANGWKLGSKP